MIYYLTKAIRLSTERCRQIAGSLSLMRDSGKVKSAGQIRDMTLAGSGMFGLLVSSDVARGRWF